MLFFPLFFCSEFVPHVGWHCHLISIFSFFSDAFRESKTAWNFAFLESSAQNNLNSVAQPIWLRHWFLSPRIHSVRVFFPEEWAGGGLFSTRKAQLKIAQYLKKSEDYFCLRRYGNIRKLGRRKQTDCAKRNSVQSQRLHLHVIEHMYVERSLRLEVQVHTTFFSIIWTHHEHLTAIDTTMPIEIILMRRFNVSTSSSTTTYSLQITQSRIAWWPMNDPRMKMIWIHGSDYHF